MVPAHSHRTFLLPCRSLRSSASADPVLLWGITAVPRPWNIISPGLGPRRRKARSLFHFPFWRSINILPPTHTDFPHLALLGLVLYRSKVQRKKGDSKEHRVIHNTFMKFHYMKWKAWLFDPCSTGIKHHSGRYWKQHIHQKKTLLWQRHKPKPCPDGQYHCLWTTWMTSSTSQQLSWKHINRGTYA